MSANFPTLRSEGQKHACLAAQTEGEAQKNHVMQAVICDALADLIANPEAMAMLVAIATKKPTLTLVHNQKPE